MARPRTGSFTLELPLHYQVLRLERTCERVGLGPATVYRLMQDGEFPRQILLGGNSRGWLEHEIDDWIEQRIKARDNGTDAEARINPNIGRGRPRKNTLASIEGEASEPRAA
jgi:prophage regulatory protein